MFFSLWLLASMLLDALTPPELTFYMIGPAIAPAVLVAGLLYWLRIPALDYAVVFGTLWMVSEMVLEMISPKPLSPLMAVLAVAPLLLAGILVNVRQWRHSGRRDRPAPAAPIKGLPGSPGPIASRRPL
ncbi:conserved hypothetical protein; putative membrane protein [Bradyrhizobium sp. ORS 278]|uniref:hypothetical protein n=1 Tax=Bradyrhizobium sp. (strain ORS 278) TaxID=114615 RepID=UPI0001508129|nr:hypothetical protein [Bradyrhizobium sp. ORS 278]CAL77478.1 conserved hypothetical protein; putative membrane protein [Bradyrhizobium sp. ORS 278]